ncbi:MAG TPA: alpha/beta hydrolase-fold protein [Polyangium sp.]|nr:alpha/beta hydrolase-fold protein [Polyangium sp.]
MRTTRRDFLIGASAAAWTFGTTRRAEAGGTTDLGGPDLDVRDLDLPGDRALGRRMTLSIPRGLDPTKAPAPLLVLLHGLGETGDERMGAYAWLERYGLATSFARLGRPPVVRTSKRLDFTDEHLRAVNEELTRTPFRGFVIACPYTPNVNKAANPKAALDGYARWIAEVVVPRARREAHVATDVARTALDGCSLGGYVALEVFSRHPETFGAIGVVQTAIGAHRTTGYADRLATIVTAHGARGVHVETSTTDPFRAANEALSAELTKRNVPHDAVVLPGPHDQPWLREVGTLEMLRWHDRRFRGLSVRNP